jgi:hypothetical protein
MPARTWFYNREGRALQGLAAFMSSDALPGQQILQMAQQLAEAGLQGELRLRQGLPEEQIRQEITGGNYDLAVMMGRPEETGWWTGDLVVPTLRWLDRPLLLVRPA